MNLLGAGVLIACATPLCAQQSPPRLADFLRQRIGLDSAQIASVERGGAVVSVLDAELKRDVAVFGIIAVDVPRSFYVNRLNNVSNSLPAFAEVEYGVFHVPASPEDVKGATVSPGDLSDIKSCRPGNCVSKMPAADMQQMASIARGADVQSQANVYLRRRLVDYANDYRARGDSALVVYDDVGGIRQSDAFAALMAQSPWVYQDLPSLRDYLARYPRGELPGAHELLFWSNVAMSGMRPVLTVTHMVWYTPPELSSVSLMAAKQIYASHYFEAAFNLTAVVDRPGNTGSPGGYVLLLQRFRFDRLPTGPLNIRGKVIGKMRDQLRDGLVRQKQVAEQEFAKPLPR